MNLSNPNFYCILYPLRIETATRKLTRRADKKLVREQLLPVSSQRSATSATSRCTPMKRILNFNDQVSCVMEPWKGQSVAGSDDTIAQQYFLSTINWLYDNAYAVLIIHLHYLPQLMLHRRLLWAIVSPFRVSRTSQITVFLVSLIQFLFSLLAFKPNSVVVVSQHRKNSWYHVRSSIQNRQLQQAAVRPRTCSSHARSGNPRLLRPIGSPGRLYPRRRPRNGPRIYCRRNLQVRCRWSGIQRNRRILRREPSSIN